MIIALKKIHSLLYSSNKQMNTQWWEGMAAKADIDLLIALQIIAEWLQERRLETFEF